MPAIFCHTVHFPGEFGFWLPVPYPHGIDGHEFLELLVVRDVFKRVSAGGYRWNRGGREQVRFVGRQYFRVLRKGVSNLGPKQEEAFPMLRHAVVPCVQYAPWLRDGISAFFELRDQQAQELAVLAHREPLDVFENEILGIKVQNKPNKLPDKLVSRVLQHALSDEREALAGGSAANDIHTTLSVRLVVALQDGMCIETDNRGGQRCGSREVEMVNCGMNGVQLHGRNHVESGLLEPERHAAGSGEKVCYCWSVTHFRSRTHQFSHEASRASSSGIARLPKRPTHVA